MRAGLKLHCLDPKFDYIVWSAALKYFPCREGVNFQSVNSIGDQ
jgi:hypothetical protein